MTVAYKLFINLYVLGQQSREYFGQKSFTEVIYFRKFLVVQKEKITRKKYLGETILTEYLFSKKFCCFVNSTHIHRKYILYKHL